MLSSSLLRWTRRPFTPFLLPLPCTVDDSIPLAPSGPPPLPLAPGGIGTISKVGFRNRSPSFAFDEEGGALPMASEAEGPSQEKEKVKKARTTYERLGQTRETPPEGDPLRRFYTSLYEENPESLMARKWLMVHGLLDLEEVERVLLQVKDKSANKSLQETRKKVASMLELDPDLITEIDGRDVKSEKAGPPRKKARVKKGKKVESETHHDPQKDISNRTGSTVDLKQEKPPPVHDSSDDEDLPLAARRMQKL